MKMSWLLFVWGWSAVSAVGAMMASHLIKRQ